MSGAPTRAVTWVIVVAAGSGARFGGPKQYLELEGRRVLDRAVDTAARHAAGVVVVGPPADVDGDDLREVGPTGPDAPPVVVVAGGESRAASVRAGLAAVPDDAAVILVHDGARPLADDAVFERVIDAVLAGADAAVPAVPVVDTIRRVDGGVVDRSSLVAVQTPQGFAAAALRAAHAVGGDATDDATLVESDGGTVVLVDGDTRNLKITTPLDLIVAAAMLSAGSWDS